MPSLKSGYALNIAAKAGTEYRATYQMSPLLKYFDRAYLINLPERTDRLRSVQQQLLRIDAHLSPNEVDLFPALRFSDRAKFPNAGMRGCFASHLECFRRSVGKAKRLLILEDDVVFSSALLKLSAAVVEQLSVTPWDIVYFGHEATGAIDRAKLNTSPSELRFELGPKVIHTTHFYGLNAAILPRIIAHLDRVASGPEGDNMYGPMPIDGALNIFRQLNADVRCIIAIPKLGWQRPSRSDILPKVFDRFDILRPLISMARRLKHFAASSRDLRR